MTDGWTSGRLRVLRSAGLGQLSPWLMAVVVLAVLSALAALGAVLLDPAAPLPSAQLRGLASADPLPPELTLLELLVFGVTGVLLLVRADRGQGAADLGALFVTVAAGFGRRLLAASSLAVDPAAGWLAAGIAAVPLETFAPLFLWRLIAVFPAPVVAPRLLRQERLGLLSSQALALAATGGGFALALLLAAGRGAGRLASGLDLLALAASAALLVAGLVAVLAKGRTLPRLERRRARVFLLAVAIALGPLALERALAVLVPDWGRLVAAVPARRLALDLVAHAFVLTLPFTTAYAVQLHRVLGLSLIARSALRYALARTSVLAAVAAPFGILVFYLYAQRELTLTQLFSGRETLPLVALLVAGILGLSFRRALLDALDRAFFREQYNARLILSQLVDQIRGTRNATELSNLVRRGLDYALHLEGVTLLTEDPVHGTLVDPKGRVRPLDIASKLAGLAQSHRDPLEIDFEAEPSPLAGLPEEEIHWLLDARARLLAPAFAFDGSLIGLLVLGAKKSEMPFLKEDRQLLRAIGASTGLAIELMRLKEQHSDSHWERRTASLGGPDRVLATGRAMECLACCRVYAPDVLRCPSCNLTNEQAPAPHILRGVFRFEERIGTGGMAVVYRARDLKLGRTVAIKTLPRVSAEAAVRLHREARTAAAVSHPGLAAIYGIETWEGTPMLILELLEGGTLVDRIHRQRRLGAAEVVRMGQAAARALHKLHSEGILHRDIKPSNLGFTLDGQTKLLDFGIARIRDDLRRDRAIPGSDGRDGSGGSTVWQIERSTTGNIAGTLPYASPEALAGDPLDPMSDLWALAVVLHEALTGENLFRGRNLKLVIDGIREARVPDPRERGVDCPEELAQFFQEALHKDRRRRPQSGAELCDLLEPARRRLEGLDAPEHRVA